MGEQMKLAFQQATKRDHRTATTERSAMSFGREVQ
jgi:hypothetical protein